MSNTPSNTEAWDLWLESITGGHHPASLAKFARAVLAKWGTPQPVVRESSEDLYWRLHSLSKILEGSGVIDESQHPDAYSTILDAMAFIRGQQPVAREPLSDAQIAEMMRDTWGCASIAPRHAMGFARAVERAHGITQKGGS